jgi:hypothetical protein
MTEEEFRKRFNADRRENKLTWISSGAVSGIAVAIDSGKGTIILHGNQSIAMTDAEFAPDGTANMLKEMRKSRQSGFQLSGPSIDEIRPRS